MIRVFPRRTGWTPTDPLAFVGDPPMERPEIQPVAVSVAFTWDIPEGERLARAWGQFYPDVRIGGPAFGDKGGDFEPGLFLKPGVTITSRGCPRNCPWCFAWKREGRNVRELPIKDGWIVQDNNLLACSRKHIEAVAEMLTRQKKAACFNGGLDASMMKPWHRDLFGQLRIHELWFACDSADEMPEFRRAAEILADIPRNKKRCYVLMAYGDETPAQAHSRAKEVFDLGFLPFAQLYQDDKGREYGKEWQKVMRLWSRPAAMKSKKKNEGMPLFDAVGFIAAL
jgi:hypothetical protein